jgi:hypothetical protein
MFKSSDLGLEGRGAARSGSLKGISTDNLPQLGAGYRGFLSHKSSEFRTLLDRAQKTPPFERGFENFRELGPID